MIRHIAHSDAMKRFEGCSIAISMEPTFHVQRRERRQVKVMLSAMPSGVLSGEHDTVIINVDQQADDVPEQLIDAFCEALAGFLEGVHQAPCIGNSEEMLVRVDDLLIDDAETDNESRFDCLFANATRAFLDEVATRLMVSHCVEVEVVNGSQIGLLIRQET